MLKFSLSYRYHSEMPRVARIVIISIFILTFPIFNNLAPAKASWPGWGEDFSGRITSAGIPISNARIGADYGCCTESDSSGTFTIGLREGTTTIYILPTGKESVLSAPSHFKVTMVGNKATSVIDENGNELSISDGYRLFTFNVPNLSGKVNVTGSYAGDRYSSLSSPNGVSDVQRAQTGIKDQFGYKVSTPSTYVPYLAFLGDQRKYAIGPACKFESINVNCPNFDIKESNFIARIVSSSGTAQAKTSLSVRPIVQNNLISGLDAWIQSDLTFRYFLADGLYWAEPFLNDNNNNRRYFEIIVNAGQVISVRDVSSGQDFKPVNGIYNLDYQTALPEVKYKVNLVTQIPGGATFQIDPKPLITMRAIAATGIIVNQSNLDFPATIDANGLVTITGLKKGTNFQILLKTALDQNHDSIPGILAYSTNTIVEKMSEDEAKAEAEAKAKAKAEAEAKAKAETEAKAKAEAVAKAKAEAEAKAKAEATSKITSNSRKISVICTKGKLKKTIIGVNPKCPAGYTLKR